MKCKERIMYNYTLSNCSRNATTTAGYCKQHDPELSAERRKKANDAYDALWAAKIADSKRNAVCRKACDEAELSDEFLESGRLKDCIARLVDA